MGVLPVASQKNPVNVSVEKECSYNLAEHSKGNMAQNTSSVLVNPIRLVMRKKERAGIPPNGQMGMPRCVGGMYQRSSR